MSSKLRPIGQVNLAHQNFQPDDSVSISGGVLSREESVCGLQTNLSLCGRGQPTPVASSTTGDEPVRELSEKTTLATEEETIHCHESQRLGFGAVVIEFFIKNHVT